MKLANSMSNKRKPRKTPQTPQISKYLLRDLPHRDFVQSSNNNNNMAGENKGKPGNNDTKEDSSASGQKDTASASANSDQTPMDTPANSELNNGLKAMEERLMSAFEGLNNKLDKKVEEIKEDFTAKLAAVTTTLDANSKKIAELESSVNFAHKDIADMKVVQGGLVKDCKRLQERENETGKRISKLKGELEESRQDMSSQLNHMERRSREYSVRIRNMDIKDDENHVDQVAALIVEKKLAPENSTVGDVAQQIEIAHPLKGVPKGMIVRFYARPYRNLVVHQAKAKLNRVSGDGGLKLVEDMTKIDFQLKMKAQPQMQEAFKSGKKARFYRGKLIINGKQVAVNTDN